ncbi:ClpXP protease specificity-enhancing factor [Shewanella schlegeliana]|uniref:ClpXP protease specificity-enhancing factor n=1 Tax=Shewanella schlegeliana TaxID=190308 RepID=A0ABS1SXN5_9GAMM|nr:ClpXP protease specificity-enhancing factor [Shewanella schlegeliana]MBL4912770.1 ClpXP protease specificity-enhancing factor [Shewanella schlegeliana]MCL1111889.1 ClpXP protease specificity-enhancing factor [Shewanella schlegeliana]GIU30592.1 stringent starvation protein B [Shewanella schlegeliana]
MKELTPNRPYLLRAYYDWLMDNQLTPHVVVDAYVPGTQVPQQYVKDGQIVLNITESAVGGLQITNEFIEFSARFGGVPQQVLLPMASIVAIYARENGAGTVFEMEEAYQLDCDPEEESGLSVVLKEPDVETSEGETEKVEAKEPKRRGHLTLVK